MNELLLEGPELGSVIEPLLAMFDGTHSQAEIVESFPGILRKDVEKLLRTLVQRRLVTGSPSQDDNDAGIDSLQGSFWSNFGDQATAATKRLSDSVVLVIGSNRIARTLSKSLLEVGVGRVRLIAHPILDNQLIPLDTATLAPGDGRRFSCEPSLLPEWLEEATLVCATSEFGQTEALLEMNRETLAANRLYLPVWIEGMYGYAGPLNFPFESACLQCYRVRTDSNAFNYVATLAIREHLAAHPEVHFSSGLLPPMAGMMGEIAAMEAAKCIAGFPPSAAIGRIIEVNMASFESIVRRVLKIPRCPDCSTVMAKATSAATLNPLLPGY